MNLSDQEVVRKVVEGCSKGDAKYQQELYKQLYSPMLTVCYRYTESAEDAKDLFQDGFIKVFEKIGKFNFKGSLEGWIRRIMVNNAIDHYRKHKKRFVMSETLIQIERIADEEIEENIFDELTAKDLLAFVQQLSPVYRTVFNLYVLDGYSHAEISEELGISEGTSKSNLSKAKKNLKYMILQNIKNEK
ncbi:MAG: sigma-70 family RNA polymerase sigma factor [Bacteroidetes bacterium]|nr:MAG: sigma-70 family RNA polymerase sigma factor [Bacteroidota bacterium]MBL1145641.1 sigma-70 family RNA polymerase sigma factor [Bacteroidota bacterium]MCB0801676.1 sigma-70 family RNA polymerase sigma factor [Flavobacteriales bacterium]NOG58435.1 sigma-70 family RNA polymerase sigma factor [Bacteroidota bacterium]